MIGYREISEGVPLTLRNLLREIDRCCPTARNKDGTPRMRGKRRWRVRTAEKTAQFHTAQCYDDVHGEKGTEFWGELKEIYARIQGGVWISKKYVDRNGKQTKRKIYIAKCAYCECRLALRKGGSADGDIEHFRPKQRVDDWPNEHGIATGGEDATGYYLLAYHPLNYVLSCRVCNQDYKRNFFPIADLRAAGTRRLRSLRAEQPYLLHPLDPDDVDPEKVLQFTHIIADPVDPAGQGNYWRARVTIDLFNLNGRDDLRLERLRLIAALYGFLKSSDSRAADMVALLMRKDEIHTNCARSFVRLFMASPEKAEEAAKEVFALLKQRELYRIPLD